MEAAATTGAAAKKTNVEEDEEEEGVGVGKRLGKALASLKLEMTGGIQKRDIDEGLAS